jgi:hypothetical protein
MEGEVSGSLIAEDEDSPAEEEPGTEESPPDSAVSEEEGGPEYE